ncbi:hypothetical protein ACFQ34_09110 [Pseudonocardia benzenivorans]|uniref:DUF4131 domain-containing protein n=1 Tax=Pseudonocardia benzenivorans TaxID=228005 RepID=A0ABW3VE77_9PSEU
MGVATALVTVWLLWTLRSRFLRGLLATAIGLALFVWAGLVWVRSALSPGLEVLAEVPGPPDSRLRLVVLEVQTGAVDRRTYSVRVRAGRGLLAQESQLWVAGGAEARPSQVRFVDARTVEVIARGVCGYRSTVDPVTLSVAPVHRPPPGDGC